MATDPNPVGRPWSAAGRTWVGAVGVLVVAGGLVWLAGPLGLASGLAVAGLWYLVPAAYAVAGGHVLALLVAPDPIPIGPLVAVEVGFLAVLAAPLAAMDGSRSVAVTAGTGLVLGTVAWVGWTTWDPRWLVALVIVTTVAVGLYGLHRYQVARFGLREVKWPP